MENDLGKHILKDTKHEVETLREMLHKARLDGEVDSVIKLAAAIARITRDAHVAQYQADQFAKMMAERATPLATPSGQKMQQLPSEEMIEQLANLGPQATAALQNIAAMSKKLGGQKKPPLATAPAETGDETNQETGDET